MEEKPKNTDDQDIFDEASIEIENMESHVDFPSDDVVDIVNRILALPINMDYIENMTFKCLFHPRSIPVIQSKSIPF
ncbi:MAG TPA: hypothetical protein VFC65_19035 [Prolixibacteraceae bacterium]|nr:hypothetical protein [Prolixibacteraceae bacterium]